MRRQEGARDRDGRLGGRQEGKIVGRGRRGGGLVLHAAVSTLFIPCPRSFSE